MYTYEYTTLQELAYVARKHGITLSEAALRHETETSERTVRSSGDDGGTIERLS